MLMDRPLACLSVGSKNYYIYNRFVAAMVGFRTIGLMDKAPGFEAECVGSSLSVDTFFSGCVVLGAEALAASFFFVQVKL